MKKIIRITTVPLGLRFLLRGQMRYMQENGYEVLMISSDGPHLPDVLKDEQCRHEIVPMTRKITPWQDLKCLFQLVKIMRREKPDIVHTHTPKAGLLGMLAARITSVPVRIHTVAGLPLMVEKGFKLKLLRFIEKLTYACAHYVWPNSPSMKKFIVEEKLCAENKLSIIGKGSSNGVDINRFNRNNLDAEKINRIKARVNHDPQYTYFLFVGRMVSDKGIIELVNVFEKLANTDSRLRLILGGPLETSLDPLPQHILDMIKNHPSIIFIDWLDDVEYYMSVVDFFVFPSHREGFPNVLLEAGAMKLPVICSNIPGNIDIVTNLQTGLLFNCRDEASLHAQFDYALKNRHKVAEMSEELYQYITTNFTRKAVWNCILEQYNRITRKPVS